MYTDAYETKHLQVRCRVVHFKIYVKDTSPLCTFRQNWLFTLGDAGYAHLPRCDESTFSHNLTGNWCQGATMIFVSSRELCEQVINKTRTHILVFASLPLDDVRPPGPLRLAAATLPAPTGSGAKHLVCQRALVSNATMATTSAPSEKVQLTGLRWPVLRHLPHPPHPQ